MILAVCAFTHVNARLLLIRQALSEELAVAGLLQGVMGFDGEEFSNALSDAFTPRDGVQVSASVECLLFDPGSSARRILVFEPAVGVGDRNSVEYVRHRLEGRMGRRHHQLMHS